VTDHDRVHELFEKYGWGATVFHCAAHKHVPMMQNNVGEAVKNNFGGTKIVADACARWGVSTMVNVSTDKAVHPVSVMGNTKALAEAYVRQFGEETNTAFCSVRFGNVIGSSGSVLETWVNQRDRGLPITLTDPDMTRYFMSLEEAAGLVLQASTLARGGETFALDMGAPICMGGLARKFLRANPGTEMEVTGIRPGERRHESLTGDGERTVATSLPGVLRVECTCEDNVVSADGRAEPAHYQM